MVFTTEAGQSLLAEWERLYVTGRVFHVEPLEMAKRAACKDFVTDLKSYIQEVKSWS